MKKFLYLVACLFISLVLFSYAFCQNEERITITTYYPSPAGSYRQLEVRRMAINAGTADNPMPNEDGVINFSGLPSPPAFIDEGALYYDSGRHAFQYYNGTQWVPTGCFRYFFSATSGQQACPTGTAVPVAPVATGTTGTFLCCPVLPPS